MRFGNTNFDFEGRGKALIVPWLTTWIIPGAFLVYGFFSVQTAFVEAAEAMAQGVPAGQNPKIGFTSGMIFFPIGALLFSLTFIWYRIREFRYFASCLGFGATAFQSGAKTRYVVLPMLLAGAIIIFALSFAFFVVFGAIFGIVHASGTATFGVEAFIPILIPLAVILFQPAITYPVVVFTIVRHLWTTLSVTNPKAFEEAAQSAEEAPKFGEGLADAFDVGAI